jgi:non-specific serine/threonine protein kinase
MYSAEDFQGPRTMLQIAIADTLIISEGTVEVHVKHILSKLGFRSRAQVAGWFARQGPG